MVINYDKNPALTVDQKLQSLVENIQLMNDEIATKFDALELQANGFVNEDEASAAAPVQSVNGMIGGVVVDADDVGAVPTTRKVNNKALSADITLDADDVGAVPNTATTPSISITTTSGELVGYFVRQFGKVVQLGVTVRNSASVASSGNVFTGTLNTTALIPLTYITGGAYYGAHAIMGSVGTTGAITIRNASSTAVTISGTNTVSVTWTYIVA